MELYTRVSYAHSRQLTLSYSTSFGVSSRLFPKDIQPHIYAIYGLVRIADEIVDTYRGDDAGVLLDALENTTIHAIETGYDVNPIVHAFAVTARKFAITEELIAPFFTSMRMDLPAYTYRDDEYETYIHGSAEVVGLMCLRIFCRNNTAQYEALKPGAMALGSAYQKVNFLRDLAADYKDLGRLYFPGVAFDSFDNETRDAIIKDIRYDFSVAQPAIARLPRSCRSAVAMSYVYYTELLKRLEASPASYIKEHRIRVSSRRKLQLLAKTILKEKLSA